MLHVIIYLNLNLYIYDNILLHALHVLYLVMTTSHRIGVICYTCET